MPRKPATPLFVLNVSNLTGDHRFVMVHPSVVAGENKATARSLEPLRKQDDEDTESASRPVVR